MSATTPETPEHESLARAAASLEDELARTARFVRVGDRVFDRVVASDPGFLAVASELGREAVVVGDFTVNTAPGTLVRAGVLRDGSTLALAVHPRGRGPYLELTTFLARPPAAAREVITTNGRPDPAAARPATAALEQRPRASLADLRRRHLERVTAAPGEPVRVWIEPTEQGVLRAIADYLKAIGC